MKAFVIQSPNQAEVIDMPYPTFTSDEVVIKVERVGICGTDFHIYSGDFIAQYPIVPGHEFSGTIVEIGSNVKKFNIGDRVAAEPNTTCGHCLYCTTNRQNHCLNWEAVGVTRHGAMAEYVAVPFQNVFTLPDSMTFEEGAFLEPIACVVHGLNQLTPKIGDAALVIGAGAMGQQLVQGLARIGVGALVVSEPSAEKRALALQNGATDVITPDQIESYIEHNRQGLKFDIVVDVTGIPAVIEKSFQYLGKHGRFLQFGVSSPHATVSIQPFEIFNNDWKIIGSKATNSTFQAALSWVEKKRIIPDQLVSRALKLDDCPKLFEQGLSPTDFKVQIQL